MELVPGSLLTKADQYTLTHVQQSHIFQSEEVIIFQI